MIHSSFLRSTPLWLVLAATAAASASEVPTDPFGRPLFDSAANPLFYQPGSEPKENLSPALAPSPISAMAADPWNLPASPGGAPFWGHSVFGTQIGLAGWVTATRADGLDLIVSATSPASFAPNNFWYVLNYDPATQSYRQVHVQRPYTVVSGEYHPFTEMAAMTSAQVVGGAKPELVVGLADGRFFFYSLATFQEVGRIRPVEELKDFTTADLTGDGIAELLILTEDGLKVFNASGVLLWSVTGPTGEDLVVAQMDDDPGLEIATTSGHVIDAGTRTIQWTHDAGFGANLRTADIDGDSRAELIAAEAWYNIHAFDVEAKSLKWTFRTERDTSAIEIGNVDADPQPELLYGDYQHGSVHVLTLGEVQPVRKWRIATPDSGIPRIAVLDADQDGVAELIWSGGSNSTGEDRLNVVDPATQALEWQSTHLDGPFLGPVMGDVTGDGKPELVTASSESKSGYSSGCILVFDPETLALRASSPPFANGHSIRGVQNLKLRDIDGDGRQEIVMAGDRSYNGLVEIYGFTDAGGFELEWQSAGDPSGSPYTQADVMDVDGDGNLEVVTTNESVHSGSEGFYLRVIDLATKAVEWSSFLPGPAKGANGLVVDDVDDDGMVEAVVALGSGGIRIFDLKSRLLEGFLGGDCDVVVVRPEEAGFIAGHRDGTIKHYSPDGAGSYAVTDSWKASNQAISGLAAGSGQSLWVSAGERLTLWPDHSAPGWSTLRLGSPTGPASLYQGTDGLEIYTSLSHGVAGFKVGGSSDFSTMRLEGQGGLIEGGNGKIKLTVTRSTPGAGDTVVILVLRGEAVAGEDFNVTGASPEGEGRWSVLIPAGQTSAIVTLELIEDSVSEDTESISAELEASTDYFLGTPRSFQSEILDNESLISVVTGDASASELKSGRATDQGTFILRRTGGILSRPLAVRLSLSGTATPGSDYRKIGTKVTFPKNKDTVEVKILPIHDRRAEADELVQLQLLPSDQYGISETGSQASLTILDAEPTVSLTGTSSVEGGVAVNLTRSGGHSLPIVVTLKLRFEEDGVVRTSQRKLSFKAGAESAQYLVKPSPRATSAAQVTVEVLDTGAFHRGVGTSATFTLPVR